MSERSDMLLDQMLDLCESVWRLSLRVNPDDYQSSRLPFAVHQIGCVVDAERPGRLQAIADEEADERVEAALRESVETARLREVR